MKIYFRTHQAIFFVLLTVMINSIGFGIIIPVLPELLIELTGLPANQAAIHGGWMTFVFALMQFICMPIVGALSDTYGRRPIMLLSLFGLSLDYFLMGLAPTIIFLYFGRFIAGGLSSTFTTANAYIADISPPKVRAQNFALVGAAFGVGFMIGPAIGGQLSIFGPRAPFLLAGTISLANVIFGLIVLPETLPKEKRRPYKWKRANPLGSLHGLKHITGARGFMLVLFLLALAHTTYPSTYAFSTIEKLNWTSYDVGWSLFFFGLASIIVQGGLIRIAIPRLGLYWATIIGVTSAIIAYIGMGLATQGWLIYAMGPFAALAGFANPALTNLMSTRINASEQGELQGAIGAIQGLALMIGPLIMVRVFELYAAQNANPYQPGAPFFLASLFALCALLLFFMHYKRT